MNRLAKGLLAGAAALALSLSAAAPASAGPLTPNRDRYAALGDSFAAGVGNTLLPRVGDSLRSSEAYPVLLASKVNKVTFLAENGATTADVLAQVASVPSSAQQVTVTVGGNDLGFATVALACAANVTSDACQAAISASGVAQALLPGNLMSVLGAIRAQAPLATIYVTGYPRLFQMSGDTCLTFNLASFPYDPAALAFADEAADDLNAVIAGTVAQYALVTQDPNLVYVNVADDFDGHGVCNPTGSFIFPPSFYPGSQVPEPQSLHPNADGQQAYADAVLDAQFNGA